MSEGADSSVAEQGDFTLDDLFSSEQIRLAEISVYNWGPFGRGSEGVGHTARIHPESTFIIGENEAGKSTLIDAFQVVLNQPSRAAFNIAAAKSSKRDRNLVSYIRGRYLSEGADDVVSGGGVVRNGSVISIVRAVFTHGDARYTCLVLFRIPTASTEQSDVVSLYIGARRDLSIQEVLDWYGQGEKKGIEAAIAGDPNVSLFKTFPPYAKYFRELLGLENPNAMELLSRALGLKEINNLTQLIQDLVLEPCAAVETAREVVKAFGDARSAYQRLKLIRDQRDCLLPLRGHWDQIQKCDAGLQMLVEMEQVAPARIAYRLAEEWTHEVQARDEKRRTAEDVHKRASRDHADAESRYERALIAFNDAGGHRLKLIEMEIKTAGETKQEVESTVLQCGLALSNLGCPKAPDTESAFGEMRTWLTVERAQLSEKNQGLLTASREGYRHIGNREDEIRTAKSELTFAINRPGSSVEQHFHNARAAICNAVGASPSAFPFVAELIEVKTEEASWRGAIERALGGLRRNMLVPAEMEREVAAAADPMRLGLLLDWKITGEAREPPQFRDSSMLRKLNWKPDATARDWLKGFLARQCDYVCVDTTDDLKLKAPAVTIRGLVSRGKGSYRKDDRRAITDTGDWVLGFSNEGRIASLKERIKEMEGGVAQLRIQAEAAEKALQSSSNNLQMVDKLLSLTWSELDFVGAESRHASLLRQREQLVAQGTSLEAADVELNAATKAKDASLAALNRAHTANDLADRAWKEASEVREVLMQLVRPVEPPELCAALDVVLDDLKLERLATHTSAHALFKEALSGKRGAFIQERSRAISRCSDPITRFTLQLQRPDAGDWGKDADAIPRFIAELDEIEQEGLPKLVNAMRDRLNEFSSQQLISVNAEIKDAQDAIKDRIEAINAVLRRTELRAGTYLALKPRSRKAEAVNDFEGKLQAAVESGFGDDPDARYLAIEAAVEVLEKATDPQRVNLKDSLILLDPRHRFDFVAEELGVEDNQLRDQWTSSSGKSGGAKEIFAGTIVAASLAYVLTPKGAKRPQYCTVFLDEAFSNTSVAYSGRVIRTFAQLQLHLNLITPLKNIELARAHAKSLVLVSKTGREHSSVIREVTWEYLESRLGTPAAAAA